MICRAGFDLFVVIGIGIGIGNAAMRLTFSCESKEFRGVAGTVRFRQYRSQTAIAPVQSGSTPLSG